MKAGKIFLSKRVAVINFITGTKTLKAVIESISPTKLKETSIILEWNPSSGTCDSLISPLHHEDLPQIRIHRKFQGCL